MRNNHDPLTDELYESSVLIIVPACMALVIIVAMVGMVAGWWS